MYPAAPARANAFFPLPRRNNLVKGSTFFQQPRHSDELLRQPRAAPPLAQGSSGADLVALLAGFYPVLGAPHEGESPVFRRGSRSRGDRSMASPHAAYHFVTATCHRSCHVFPVLPPTRSTSSCFATTHTPATQLTLPGHSQARSLLIHSILSRRSNPGSRPLSTRTFVAYLAWLVTFLLGNEIKLCVCFLSYPLQYVSEHIHHDVSAIPLEDRETR